MNLRLRMPVKSLFFLVAIENWQFAFSNVPAVGGFLAACLLALGGCKHAQTRGQAGEESDSPDKEAEVKTVGDITSFANADPIPASGVGLVVGLEGTGGNPPHGSYLQLLEDQLAKEKVQHVKEIMASPNTSLVLVSTLIPAGAHKEDPLDIEVTLPEGSHTTSLRGGYLKECYLFDYDNKKHLDPNYQGTNSTLIGHMVALAHGPLLVGFGSGEESVKQRQGRIWGGGRTLISRPFYLVLGEGKDRGPDAERVADRVNELFHGPYHGGLSDIAAAKNGSVVYLGVPQQYRHNLPRYLRVVRLIPLEASREELGSYRRRLEKQLLDPAHCVTAALRLEALGKESVPSLKTGLESSHVIVRFCAAEALAYLDDPSCGQELARLAEQQPALRAFCLTAMASLDEAISHVKLAELLSSSSSETRYGSFRALRGLDEQEPTVAGEQLNESFWLHRVAPDSSPLVHLSSSRRAEVVLFGDDPSLTAPFSFLTGEFTITAARDDQRCTISRFSVQHGTLRRQCSLHLEAVLHTLADMGALYPEVFEMLRQAGAYHNLSCPLAIDALPQATSVYELAKSGAGKNPDLLEAEDEISQARDDLGATPTLFSRGTERRSLSTAERPSDAISPERPEKQTKKETEAPSKPAT